MSGWGGGVFLHVVPLLNLNVRTPYHDHRHANDIHIGIIVVINNHWRIEGGGQGGLAPPPPKIGYGVVNSRSQTKKV